MRHRCTSERKGCAECERAADDELVRGVVALLERIRYETRGEPSSRTRDAA